MTDWAPAAAAMRRSLDKAPDSTIASKLHYVLSAAGNKAEAEDVAQEVFITVFKTIESFREEAKFSTWLYRVTTTAALMYLRRQRRWSREVTPATAADDGPSWIETRPDPAPAPDADSYVQNADGTVGAGLDPDATRIPSTDLCDLVRGYLDGALDATGDAVPDASQVQRYPATMNADNLDIRPAAVVAIAVRVRVTTEPSVAPWPWGQSNSSLRNVVSATTTAGACPPSPPSASPHPRSRPRPIASTACTRRCSSASTTSASAKAGCSA